VSVPSQHAMFISITERSRIYLSPNLGPHKQGSIMTAMRGFLHDGVRIQSNLSTTERKPELLALPHGLLDLILDTMLHIDTFTLPTRGETYALGLFAP
jgi:hypothetical protein